MLTIERKREIRDTLDRLAAERVPDYSQAVGVLAQIVRELLDEVGPSAHAMQVHDDKRG